MNGDFGRWLTGGFGRARVICRNVGNDGGDEGKIDWSKLAGNHTTHAR